MVMEEEGEEEERRMRRGGRRNGEGERSGEVTCYNMDKL